jgi:hypothetical protein
LRQRRDAVDPIGHIFRDLGEGCEAVWGCSHDVSSRVLQGLSQIIACGGDLPALLHRNNQQL